METTEKQKELLTKGQQIFREMLSEVFRLQKEFGEEAPEAIGFIKRFDTMLEELDQEFEDKGL